MNMLVGAATIASGAPISVADAVSARPDAELLALTDRFLELLPAYEAALERSSELARQYDERLPQRPEMLRWRLTDKVGFVVEGRDMWCNSYNIDLCRGKKLYDWCLKDEFEADFWALPEDDQLSYLGEPKEHVQYMFSKSLSKHKQNRMNKLIAALDEYQAAQSALEIEIGTVEADRILEECSDPLCEIVDQIDEIEPQTAGGIKAKATILLKWYWRDRDAEKTTFIDDLAHDLVSRLASLQIAA